MVQTIVTASGPGDAALAMTWQSQFNFQSTIVWGDTTDYMYMTWMQGAPFNAGYPGGIVVDVDTMTLTSLSAGGPEAASGAIQAILDADHPCAEY